MFPRHTKQTRMGEALVTLQGSAKVRGSVNLERSPGLALGGRQGYAAFLPCGFFSTFFDTSDEVFANPRGTADS